MKRHLTFCALLALGLTFSSLGAAPSAEVADSMQPYLVATTQKALEGKRPAPMDAVGEDKIWIQARVNGQPVRLAFDTGAEASFLFRRAAKRIGLGFADPPSDFRPHPGRVAAGWSEECTLLVRDSTFRTRFRIIDGPPIPELSVDGVLAWANMSESIFRFRGAQRVLDTLTEVPQEAATWLKCELQPNRGLLVVRIPSKDGPQVPILIDTGTSCGVELSGERWRQWSQGRRDEPATLIAYWTPADGLLVRKQLWARRLTFGQLTISEVPVQQCSPSQEHLNYHEGIFGLSALNRLDVIVDGSNACAYLRPSQHPPLPYEHNRMGAVFVPGGAGGTDLVAQVLEASPAYAAGIRSGDMLLRVGDLDVTKWRTDPRVLPLSRFWCRPAGSRLELLLRRKGQTFQATVELKEILSPELEEEGGKATQRRVRQGALADPDRPRR